jgi:hypothetical protein
MLLGQTRAVERLHHTDRKPPSSFHLSESGRAGQGDAASTTITDTHHMPLEFQQTCPGRSCRGLCQGGICGPAERSVNREAHTVSGTVTHRKIDLLNFSGSCVLAHAEELIGIFWSMGRPRCMKEPLQEDMKGRPGKEG